MTPLSIILLLRVKWELAHKIRYYLNFSNFFLHIPSTSMITINHKKFYTVEAILERFKTCMAGEAPARCVMVLSRSEKKNIIDLALRLGGNIFLELKRNQSCMRCAYRFMEKKKNPVTMRNTEDLVFILIQNNWADLSFPISFANIRKQITEWASRHGVQEFVLSPIQSTSTNWKCTTQSLTEISPIATYHHNYFSVQQLLNFTTKGMASWLDKIHKETEKKSFLFAGFFPKALYSMLKKYRPESYKEDLHEIRFELLEMNCLIFEWYVNMNTWLHKLSGSKDYGKLEMKNSDVASDSERKKEKLIGQNRKIINVHTNHQDRKKKHKSS